MCGIFGIVRHRNDDVPLLSKLEATVAALRHRGPDGEGIHREPGIGLVHTRLSLVDLNERSNQPLWDASHRYALVYNGELYDYAELRRRLEAEAVAFRTTSDTEVLLAALIQWGVDRTLAEVEGMFAFGLYDRREQKLVVARDRLGIKPLYIHDSEEQFLFASNVNALRPWLALRPNKLTVSGYLQGGGGPTAGDSFYEGISTVPPGTVIQLKRGARPRYGQFFRMQDLIDPEQAEELNRAKPEAVVDHAEQLLLNSVRSQLQADANMGGLCSGGVDSSLIMAMASRLRGDLPIFHADVVGPLSECSAAERLARHLKLDFHRVAVHDQHFVDCMPDILDHFGFPFSFQANSVPFLLVSQLVAEHGVKAVLCGEGSDECYLGYPWLLPNIRATLRRLPKHAFRGLSQLVKRCERRLRGKGPLPCVSARDQDLVLGMQNQFEREIGPLGYDEFSLPKADGHRPELSLVAGGDLTYILRTLLHRNDSLGMAAGIESRFPFLDTRLMKFSVNLPRRFKVRFSPLVFDWGHLFFRDKWIIRQVAKRYLPGDLSQRKKLGFPVNAYNRLTICDELFHEESFVADLFQLSRARLGHLLSRASYALRLRLLHVETWGQVCIRAESKADVVARLRWHVKIRRSNGLPPASGPSMRRFDAPPANQDRSSDVQPVTPEPVVTAA